MTTADFTKNICFLILQMITEGERPILTEVKRTREQQHIYFLERKSKCDGYKKISDHQMGKGGDIYFDGNSDGKLDDPKKGWKYWHAVWESLGGKPMIECDPCHFGAT